MEGNVILTMKEQRIISAMVELVHGQINNEQAAKRLGLSIRQVQRKKKLFLKYGVKGIIHKSKGKSSGRGYDEEFKEQIVSLYVSEYLGWNYSHFRDNLEDEHNINVSRPFIYRLLTAEVGASPKAKKSGPKSHPPRARRENAGELLQVDASKHYWLGEELGYLYLHGAIDDATGIVTACVLMEQELTEGYQILLRDTMMRYGIPACLYTDYRTIFKSPKKLSLEEQIAGQEVNEPRFVKMLHHLGVDIISTMDPRAKGRIERLWSTFQDRLIKELKKKNIKTIEEANRYINDIFLPRYNARFASPIDYNKNLFVPVSEDFDYNLELATYEERKILHHSYIKYLGQYYAICDESGAKVLDYHDQAKVYSLLDGTKKLYIPDQFYNLEPVARVKLEKPKKPKLTPEELSRIRSEAGRKGRAKSPWRFGMTKV